MRQVCWCWVCRWCWIVCFRCNSSPSSVSCSPSTSPYSTSPNQTDLSTVHLFLHLWVEFTSHCSPHISSNSEPHRTGIEFASHTRRWCSPVILHRQRIYPGVVVIWFCFTSPWFCDFSHPAPVRRWWWLSWGWKTPPHTVRWAFPFRIGLLAFLLQFFAQAFDFHSLLASY